MSTSTPTETVSGTSVCLSDSFCYEGVPPHIMVPIYLAVHERLQYTGNVLEGLEEVRDATSPAKAGSCWDEIHLTRGGGRYRVKVRKCITHVEQSTEVPLHLRASFELKEAPCFFPRFHGTHTVVLTASEDGKSTLVRRTSAFVLNNLVSKVLSFFLRGFLNRQFQAGLDQETKMLYFEGLRQMAAKSSVFSETALDLDDDDLAGDISKDRHENDFSSDEDGNLMRHTRQAQSATSKSLSTNATPLSSTMTKHMIVTAAA